MKIRIKGNTIRLRLTKSEVDHFANFRSLSETTDFGSTVLTYSLKQYEGDRMIASFLQNEISLLIPRIMADEWVKTEKVGFDGVMEIGNGKQLFLLLEKDFKCLDTTTEDQSDNYDNPLAHLHK